MRTLLKDIVFCLRLLRKSPGFTTVVVVSLGLGIGVNTTIFSFVNAVLLRPLPSVEQPDRLVEIYTSYAGGMRFGAVSYLDYVDLRDRNQVFDGIMAQRLTLVNLSRNGENEIVPGAVVSGNYFSVLGVKAGRGRTFLPEEDQTPGASPVAVISHGLWQRRFAAEPSLVGQTITINARSFTVVGIAPQEFVGANVGLAPDIWIPLMMQAVAMPGADRLKERGIRWLELVGRVKPGVSLKQARAATNTVAAQLAQENPATNRATSATVVGLGQGTAGIQSTLSPILTLLMVIVLSVLLLACFNVANLLLVRATARRKEIGIRLAMGATRTRLVRQLLTESLLLSAFAGAAAFPLAYLSSLVILALKPPTSFPILLDPKLDSRILIFAVVISFLTGIIFGLVPAIQTSSTRVLPALKDESSLQGYSKSRLRSLFVVAQVAVSFVLLISAGLFIRSLLKARTNNVGFQSQSLLIASLDVGLGGYDEKRGSIFYQQLIQRIEALPSVSSASLAKTIPLEVGVTQQMGVAIEGHETPSQTNISMDYNIVTPRYFETMGIPLLQGQDFSERDVSGNPGVVIVNEALAQRYWPGQSPLGKRITTAGGKGRVLSVVGLAKNSKYYGFREDSPPFIYLPFAQFYRPGMTLQVTTSEDPRTLLKGVRQQVQDLDRGVPVFNVKTMAEHLGVALFELRTAAALLSVFGLLALFLSTAGLYGLMAYSVSQRKREIGIRMALGAQQKDIFKLLIREGMLLTLIGLITGLVAAVGLTRFLSTLLYGVNSLDLLTYAFVALLLAGVALLASFFPAREATKVDPVRALSYE